MILLLAFNIITWWINRRDVNKVKRMLRRKESKHVFIFVLDDSRDDLELLERNVLKKVGHSYKLFIDEEVFLLEMRHSANVYVIDHFLFTMTGLDMVQKIRDKNMANFIIVYTGTKSDKTVSDYIEKKIDRFVHKDNPDHYELLTKAINDGITQISNL